MKVIQISVDEKLLREIDSTEEAKVDGRSAVFRRAAADYLRLRRRQAIACGGRTRTSDHRINKSAGVRLS
jgi:metal-responsive CopG/Arc/MetJ family transcriptional regulator